jgi:hypothetical protein
MAGRPKGSEARTELVQVRMTKAGKALLTKARGTKSISDYVRDLIAQDVARRKVQ